jgi:YgiT-type zinc finger domain-containing protein
VECYFCRGEMKKGSISYAVNRSGYHLVIDRVPCWVCQQCGEPYFDSDAVDAIQELIRETDTRVHSILQKKVA